MRDAYERCRGGQENESASGSKCKDEPADTLRKVCTLLNHLLVCSYQGLAVDSPGKSLDAALLSDVDVDVDGVEDHRAANDREDEVNNPQEEPAVEIVCKLHIGLHSGLEKASIEGPRGEVRSQHLSVPTHAP